MTPAEILAEARAIGVELRVKGSALQVRGQLTPELRAELAWHRSEVLELLEPRPWRPQWPGAVCPHCTGVVFTFAPDGRRKCAGPEGCGHIYPGPRGPLSRRFRP